MYFCPHIITKKVLLLPDLSPSGFCNRFCHQSYHLQGIFVVIIFNVLLSSPSRYFCHHSYHSQDTFLSPLQYFCHITVVNVNNTKVFLLPTPCLMSLSQPSSPNWSLISEISENVFRCCRCPVRSPLSWTRLLLSDSPLLTSGIPHGDDNEENLWEI